jgi:hypothetical protein
LGDCYPLGAEFDYLFGQSFLDIHFFPEILRIYLIRVLLMLALSARMSACTLCCPFPSISAPRQGRPIVTNYSPPFDYQSNIFKKLSMVNFSRFSESKGGRKNFGGANAIIAIPK